MGYSIATNTLIWQHSIEAMVKHLPPSSAELHLIDFSTNSGQVAEALHKIRPDIMFQYSNEDRPTLFEKTGNKVNLITVADNYVDAITAHSTLFLLDKPEDFLSEVLRVLRPGGRLILLDPADEISVWAVVNVFSNPKNALNLLQWHRTAKQHRRFTPERIAHLLEVNGFARILAERTLNGWAILSRGEKPYDATMSTADRVAIGASDSDNLGILQAKELLEIKGRFIHLLIHQTPNIPAWKAKTGEIKWQAATISIYDHDRPIAFAFTSLPKAVSFMQGAVLDGHIQNINKIAKFNKHVASQWDFPVLLNPTLAAFKEFTASSVRFVSIDPESAEAPDE
jgi:ubiquinone/menaquinone biosynthesis C-methylase UbiE